MKSKASTTRSLTLKAQAPIDKKSTGARKPIGARRPDRAATDKSDLMDWQSIAEQCAAELAVVNGVGEAMARTLDVKTMTKIVGDKVREIFHAEVVSIRLLDQQTNLIHSLYDYDQGEGGYVDYYEPFPLGQGLTSTVVASRQPLILGTVEEQIAQGAYIPPEAIEKGSGVMAQSSLVVPIIIGDKVLGVVGLGNYQQHFFNENHLRLLQTLSANMGVAIENARLFEAEQQRVAELQIINSVQAALAAELNIQGIYDAVGDKIRDIFHNTDMSIRIYDPSTNLVHFPYAVESGRRITIDSHPLSEKGFSSHVIRTRETVVINENIEQETEKYGSYILPGTQNEKSAVFVPLVAGDQARGLINLIDMEREHAFGDSDVRLLQTLANSMSVALENARLFDETQRLFKAEQQRAAELAIINSVQQGLASKLDMQGIIDLVGDKIREIFNADVVAIALKDGATNMIRLPYVLDHGERFFPDPKPLGGFTGHVLQTRLPLVIHTIEENNRLGAELGSVNVGGETIDNSFIYAPISSGETATGVMTIGKKEAHAFSDSDLNLITTLAASLSIALENARLFDETQRLFKAEQQRAAELALINSMQEGMASKLDFLSIVDLVGDKVREIFGTQDMSIGLYDRATNILTMPYYIEGGKRFQIDPLPLSSGFSAHVIRTRQSLMINEHQARWARELGSRLIGDLANDQSLDEQSYLGVPILKGDEAIGILTLYAERTHAFTESHVNLLETLASSMSVALENARLFDETQRLFKAEQQRAAELTVINSVQQGLASQLDFQAIIDLIGDKIRDIFDAQAVLITLYDRQTDLIHHRYLIERGQRFVFEAPLPVDKFRRRVIESLQPWLISQDYEQVASELGEEPVLTGDVPKSVLFVPMIIGSRVTGIISLQNLDREQAFSEPDVRLLTTIAASMSVALENARLFDETQRLLKETEQRAAELAIINSVQQGLASKLDMQAIYDLVGDKICEILSVQTCFIMVYDKDSETEYYPFLVEDGVRLTQEPIPHDDKGFGPLVMRTRQPVMINQNLAERSTEVGSTILGGGSITRSAIYVPLLIGDEAKGVISAQNMQRENAFSESDLRLLNTLASSMSIALENARLFAETQRLFKAEQQRAAELALINSVGEAMVKTLDVKTMTRLVGDHMREIFNADSVLLMLLDQRTGLIHVPYEYDRNEGGYIDYVEPFPLGTGLASRVITSRQPLLLGTLEDEIANGAYFPPEIIEKGTGFFSQSWLGVPIMAGGQVLGLVALADASARAFNENHLRLLQTLSSNVGVALENARLFDETKRLLKETEQRNAELALINRLQEALASKLDLQAVYELIGEKVCEVFNVQIVDIVTYDPTTHLIAMPYSYEKGDRTVISPREPYGFRLHVINSGAPLLVNENFVEMAAQYNNPLLIGDWPKSALFVPLLVTGKVTGIISIQDLDRENAFSASDVRLLQTLANAMSVAIENARLFDETKRRAAELTLINSVQQGLAAQLDVNAIFDLVGNKVHDIFDAQVVIIATHDRQTDLVNYPYAIEDGSRLVVEPRPLGGGGFAPHIIRTREPLLINTDVAQRMIEYGSTPVGQGNPVRSYLGVPLIIGGEARGVISLQNTQRENAFSESDLRLLGTLASSMGVALENARLFDETRRRASEMAALTEIGREISATLDLPTVLERLVTRAGELLGTPNGFIYLLTPSETELESRVGVGLYRENARIRLKPGEGLSGQVWATGQPIVVDGYDSWSGRSPLGIGLGQAVVGVPLHAGSKVVGVLALAADRGSNRTFNQDDVALLSRFAQLGGIAIQNARLYEDSRQRAEEMAALAEIGREISATLDLNTVLERIATRAQDVLNALDVVVRLLEPDGTLPTVVALGKHSDVFKQDVVSLGHGVTGHVAQAGVAEIVNFPLQDPRMKHVPGTEQDEGNEAIIFAPLISRDRVIGVMALWRDRGAYGPFTQSDLDFLVGLARQAAIAIENARLFDEVQRQQQYSDALVQHSPVAIVATDPAINVVTWNPAAERLFGYTAAQAVGRNLDELIANDPDLRADAVSYSKKLASESSIHAITRRTRQDSTLVDVEFWALPVIVSGEQVGYIALYHDLTYIKLAEDALQESHRRLADIINFLPDSVLVIDREGKIIAWNRAMEEMTGVKAQEMLGKGNYEYALPFYGERRPILIDLVTVPRKELEQKYAQLRMEGQVLVGETYVTHLKGGGAYLLGTASALHDSRGQIVGAIEVIRDFTERKHMEEALHQAKEIAEAATQAKSAFLATMSHEIRTPMNAIIGMSGLLLDTPLKDEQREFATIIRDSGDTLLAIINDILDFSKIEAGKMELESQPFDLRECIESALDLVASRAYDQGLDLAYVLDERAPARIMGDVTRLRQILLNLLSNALKFTETGEIVLTVKKEEGETLRVKAKDQADDFIPAHPSSLVLHFTVKDTGIGIPPDRIGHLFRSFSQLDASIARKYGGTGLGLAISKRLSEMMGGTIWAESDGVPGHGATFHFTICTEAVDAPAITHREQRGVQPQLEGRRVLIVDDNDTNRRILVLQTQKWGLLARDTASPREALQWIQRGDPFDAAILDMHMPEMDGLTLAGEIRKHRDARALPLMLFTSLGWHEAGVDAIGFAAHLTKPVKPSQLFDVLIGLFGDQGVQVEKTSPRKVQIDPEMAQRHPLRILLAEDNVVNQKLALRLLKQMGYRADMAANGLEAIQAVERQRYDVILMDVQMPEMDGLEASRQVNRRWTRAQRPRIIAMTANAMQGDREMCLAAGMDDYIAKPIRVEELVNALNRTQPHADEGGTRKMSEPLIDRATLDNLVATTDAQFVGELIATYFEDSPQLMATMQQALSDHDAEAFRRAAHSLKSNSNSLGATNLAALAKELEAMGKAGNLEGAEAKIERLTAEYAEVERVLKEWGHGS